MHRHVQKRHQTKLQAEPLLKMDFFCVVFYILHTTMHIQPPHYM